MTAHLGWHANDSARLGRMFDEMPNVSSEIGAVLYDIGRQPRLAHDFFVKYQDRLLFGKDNYQPDEFPYYWRVLETKDEYFDTTAIITPSGNSTDSHCQTTFSRSSTLETP